MQKYVKCIFHFIFLIIISLNEIDIRYDDDFILYILIFLVKLAFLSKRQILWDGIRTWHEISRWSMRTRRRRGRRGRDEKGPLSLRKLTALLDRWISTAKLSKFKNSGSGRGNRTKATNYLKRKSFKEWDEDTRYADKMTRVDLTDIIITFWNLAKNCKSAGAENLTKRSFFYFIVFPQGLAIPMLCNLN